MKKVLIGIDGSTCAAKAVRYAAEQYAGVADAEFTLVHVLPDLPAVFWDDGHILSGSEDGARAAWMLSWLDGNQRRMEPVLAKAAEMLRVAGVPAERVQTKFVKDADNVAAGLIAEARGGGQGTILIGRCGPAEGKHFRVGGVASRLLHEAEGLAVCVVQ